MRKLESSGKQMAHKEPGRFSAKSCRSLKKSAVSPAESIDDRKEGCRVSIGRRVVVLLAMVLVAATLATMSAASAFADELSDSQLRHKIDVIQNRPGPLTNQERDHIQNLRDRIDDNDDNDDDDDDDDDD